MSGERYEKPEGYDAAHKEAYERLAGLTARLQTLFRPIDVIGLLVTNAMAIRLVHEEKAAVAAWLRGLADDVEHDEQSVN